MYKIVHNGYNIKYVNTQEEIDAYINGVINSYSHLNPKKIFDRTFKGGVGSSIKSTRIIRYRYHTLYEEIFVIEQV